MSKEVTRMSERNEKDTASEEVEAERVDEGTRSRLTPLVDIYETDDAIIVEADMPGVERTDVELKIDNGVLSIVGHARPRTVTGLTPLYEEFVPGDYYRAFALGEEFDESKVSAAIAEGVLTVTLPRSERARVRKIEVK